MAWGSVIKWGTSPVWGLPYLGVKGFVKASQKAPMATGVAVVAGSSAIGGGVGMVGGSGVLQPTVFPKQGMGIVGMGPGYNTTFKKPGRPMPHNNLGATGDLTLAMHTNRHGLGR